MNHPMHGRAGDEMANLVVPILVKLAGGASMLTGAFTLGLAVQTALVFRMSGALPFIVAAMAALGVAGVVSGWGTSRGRSRAATAGVVVSGLVATLGSAWAIIGLLSGVLSPLSFGVVVFATGSTVLTALAIGPARKVTSARDALRAQGYDFGM